jgi:hypothetical protein
MRKMNAMMLSICCDFSSVVRNGALEQIISSESNNSKASGKSVARKNTFDRFRGLHGSRDNAVSIATGYWLDDRKVGVRVPVRSRIYPSPRRQDRLWGTLCLLSNGYRG